MFFHAAPRRSLARRRPRQNFGFCSRLCIRNVTERCVCLLALAAMARRGSKRVIELAQENNHQKSLGLGVEGSLPVGREGVPGGYPTWPKGPGPMSRLNETSEKSGVVTKTSKTASVVPPSLLRVGQKRRALPRGCIGRDYMAST